MRYCDVLDCTNYQPCELHDLDMANIIPFGEFNADPILARCVCIATTNICTYVFRTCVHAYGKCDCAVVNFNRKFQMRGALIVPLIGEGLPTALTVLTRINLLLWSFPSDADRWRICAALCEIQFNSSSIIELLTHLHVFKSSRAVVYAMSQYYLLPLEQRARALMLFPFIAQQLRDGNLIRHLVAKRRKNTPVSQFISYWKRYLDWKMDY